MLSSFGVLAWGTKLTLIFLEGTNILESSSLLLLLNLFTFCILGLNDAAFGIIILLIGVFAFCWLILSFILLLVSEGIFFIFIFLPKELLIDILRLIWLFNIFPLIPVLKGLVLFMDFKLFNSFSGGNFLIKVLHPISLLSLILFWILFCCFNTWSNPCDLLKGIGLENLEKFLISWNLPSSSSSFLVFVFAIEKGILFWFNIPDWYLLIVFGVV